jgi:peptidoglycan/LPS O-acetylase OafA/YrhL
MNLLSITAVWPFFVLIAFAYIATRYMGMIFPEHLYRIPQKYPAITGLRSLLSLSVFFHHAVIFYFYFKLGRWETPPSDFYTLLGQVPVAIFFSITGFLFWQKLLYANGQLPFVPFIVSRIKRIAPAYIVVSVFIVLMILITSKLNLHVSLIQFTQEILTFVFGLGALEVSTVNTMDPGLMGAGVFWTLRYEWKFYLCLPFIAYFFKYKKGRTIFYSVLLSYILFRFLFKYYKMPIGLLFLPGILSACIVNSDTAFKKIFRHQHFMLLGLLALASIFMFRSSMYTYPSLLFLTIFFVALVFLPSTSLPHKILTSKSFLMAGQASYSIYVMHTLILFVIFSYTNQYAPIAEMTPIMFWLLVTLSMILLIILSLLSYRYIEYPFLKRMK